MDRDRLASKSVPQCCYRVGPLTLLDVSLCSCSGVLIPLWSAWLIPVSGLRIDPASASADPRVIGAVNGEQNQYTSEV